MNRLEPCKSKLNRPVHPVAVVREWIVFVVVPFQIAYQFSGFVSNTSAKKASVHAVSEVDVVI